MFHTVPLPFDSFIFVRSVHHFSIFIADLSDDNFVLSMSIESYFAPVHSSNETLVDLDIVQY